MISLESMTVLNGNLLL